MEHRGLDKQLDRIIVHLSHGLVYRLRAKDAEETAAYVDADHGGRLVLSRSMAEVVYLWSRRGTRASVAWSSHRHICIIADTAKTEMVAMGGTARRFVLSVNFGREQILGALKVAVIFTDSAATLSVAQSGMPDLRYMSKEHHIAISAMRDYPESSWFAYQKRWEARPGRSDDDPPRLHLQLSYFCHMLGVRELEGEWVLASLVLPHRIKDFRREAAWLL